ncbi:MAG: phosphoribosyltransferase family protein, partial [Anaerolineales bacterium]
MHEPHPDLARILLTAEQIQDRVKAIALQISADHKDMGALDLIGILKGAFIFMADLTRQLKVPHKVDFMAVSSYGKSTTLTGAVRILMDLREPVEGRHVVIVEDIVDTGSTLTYLYNMLKSRHPASLRTCVFVQKDRQSLDVP